MHLSETRKGDLFVLGEALLWCFFPIVTALTFATISPLLSLAYSTLFGAVFFAVVIFFRGRKEELFTKGIFKHIFLAAFFIGWIFYGLSFVGIKYTSAGNAAIIGLMEIFFAYLLFNVWKKQTFSALHTLGAVLMLVGSLIIVFPKEALSFHGGDWLILLATSAAPIGNYYQQKARKMVSSETILFWRCIFTFPFFFGLVYVLKSDVSWALSGRAFWLLLVNGVLVLGLSKIMWLEAIHRISVTKAAALSSVSPLLTLVFAYFILHQSPTPWQFLSLVPLGVGLFLLTYEKAPREL